MSSKTYPTFDDAQRRVENLKARGMWPGIISLADGRFALTFDPDLGGES